jgi:thiamine biosynthesis lipoprotein
VRTLPTAACVLLLSACGAAAPQVTLLSGQTMGSAWTVKLAGALPHDAAALRTGVQAQFDAVDAALSTYRADSALSRFNAAPHDQWQALDPELFAVLHYALQLAAISDGAYDVTIAPLVDLWGFGPDPAREAAPSPAAIEQARTLVGWRQVELDAQARRARRPPGVRVDLSSLGKGRGVDRVAAWLDSQGVQHYLIDLSGKLRSRGQNAQGHAWRVAVEKPEADAASGEPNITDAVVELRDESVASAGDYRRYFESGGRAYSHLIDPATGQPIDHRTGSATALAPDCMAADAWATLLTLVPQERALQLADANGIAALLVVRDESDDSGYGIRYRLPVSAAWRQRLP